jgi:hypothetical protein
MFLDNAEIISGVKTKQKLSQILRELEDIEAALYNQEKGFLEHKLQEEITAELKGILDKGFTDGVIRTGHEEFSKFIGRVKEIFKSAEVVEITLGLEPSQTIIDKLSVWVKKFVSQECVIDCKVDSSVIAGAIVVYQGRYCDATVNKKWEEVWGKIRKEMVVTRADN